MAFEPGVKTESGYLAVPSSGSGPGVLVLHAWWGLNDFFATFCDRLAEAGFVALAPDLYDGKIASTIEDAEALSNALDETVASGKILTALESLRQNPAATSSSVATIGFSLGAYFALQLAPEHAEVAATVLFYGIGPLDMNRAHGVFLGHFAAPDSYEPIEQVREFEAGLRASGKDVTFYEYPGVGHWFMEDNRPDAYNAEAASQGWERTLAFLYESLS